MAKYKKRKDGYYMANIVIGHDENGKRIYAPSIYARSIPELEKKKAEVKTAIQTGTYADDHGITLGQWAEKWLQIYKSAKEEATQRRYEYAIKLFEPIADIRLKDLRKSDIQLQINRKAGFIDAQIIMRITIRQMLNDAIEDGLVYKNVANKIEVPKKPKPDKRALTPQEIAAIAKCEFTDRERAYVYILYYTGLRREEVLALTKSDIWFATGEIDVNKAITWASKTEKVLIKSPKSAASARQVDMPQALSEYLKQYVKTLPGLYLFTMQGDELMSQTSYRRMWDQIRNKINILMGGTNHKKVHGKIVERGIYATDITAYTFRHNYASMLYKNGVDVKEAQRLLGHAKISTTLDIYTHFSEDKPDLSQKLNKFKAI